MDMLGTGMIAGGAALMYVVFKGSGKA